MSNTAQSSQAQMDRSTDKIQQQRLLAGVCQLYKRRTLTAVLWLLALIPLWVALYAHPVGFWQTGAAGCAQLVTGAAALGATILIWE